MKKVSNRTVFVGTFHHAVDEKNRVAIPAKWRAAARGAQEFYVLPDPKNHLVVLPESAMTKMRIALTIFRSANTGGEMYSA